MGGSAVLLIRRLTLAMLIVLIGAVALATFLNYAKFEATLKTLVRSRFEVVGLDLKKNVEHGLALGLTLSGLLNTQKIIEQAQETSPEIGAIEVFDDRGVVRFSTTAGLVGSTVPGVWLDEMRTTNTVWSPSEADPHAPYRIGLPLTNSLQMTVGAIVIDYSRSYVSEKVDATLRYLLALAMILIVVGTAAAYAVISMMFGAVLRSISRIEALAQTVGQNPGGLDDTLADGPEPGLNTAFSRFLSRAEAARRDRSASKPAVAPGRRN